jgi:hypothetical protein
MEFRLDSLDFFPPLRGGSAAASSHDANSTSTLAHALSQHAESLQQHMEVSTRAAASTSIGEVATRNHQ